MGHDQYVELDALRVGVKMGNDVIVPPAEYASCKSKPLDEPMPYLIELKNLRLFRFVDSN